MDTVSLDGQGRRIGLQLDTGQQICHHLGKPGGQTAGDLLQNEIADLRLVLNQSIHCEQPSSDTFHGMLF